MTAFATILLAGAAVTATAQRGYGRGPVRAYASVRVCAPAYGYAPAYVPACGYAPAYGYTPSYGYASRAVIVPDRRIAYREPVADRFRSGAAYHDFGRGRGGFRR